MNDMTGNDNIVPFPGKDGLELGPGSAYEMVTRAKVEELTTEVKEIRARIDGIFWLIAGSIVVEVLLRAIGAGQ